MLLTCVNLGSHFTRTERFTTFTNLAPQHCRSNDDIEKTDQVDGTKRISLHETLCVPTVMTADGAR